MKRSEINQEIELALGFFKQMNFHLPRWALWSPEEWQGKADQVREIIDCGLGWDITDFGSGDFQNVGLINFNLRNGVVNQTRKDYCEKIIIVKERQVTPLHTHYLKIEDIINRGGGNLVIKLFSSDENLKINDLPATVKIDAIPVTVPGGSTITLHPGESVFLEPGVYHEFYGESGKGLVLVGEVSSVNDDATDNLFVETRPRFPEIIEDVAPKHLLVNDYPRYI